MLTGTISKFAKKLRPAEPSESPRSSSSKQIPTYSGHRSAPSGRILTAKFSHLGIREKEAGCEDRAEAGSSATTSTEGTTPEHGVDLTNGSAKMGLGFRV